MTGDDAVRIERKVQEIFRALNLEKRYSKEQILEAYLNTVYYSNSAYGVQAAANTYFGKDVSELSLAQSASIIGITQFPGKYDPFVHPTTTSRGRSRSCTKCLSRAKLRRRNMTRRKRKSWFSSATPLMPESIPPTAILLTM
jgi:membrane peptidoglycan carboxypeptidase